MVSVAVLVVAISLSQINTANVLQYTVLRFTEQPACPHNLIPEFYIVLCIYLAVLARLLLLGFLHEAIFYLQIFSNPYHPIETSGRNRLYDGSGLLFICLPTKE